MKNIRPDLLSRPLFLLGLGLLLLNDFYLKYEYSNILTGKLSDFAGLFIFPYLFSSFRQKSTTGIYVFTAIIFIFWKSAFSQGVIELVQSTGVGIDRVIDITDLIALSILPVSFCYFKSELGREKKVSKGLSVPLSIVTLFAIFATTVPKKGVDVNMKVDKAFEIKISKKEVFNSMLPRHNYSNNLERNLNDSLFYLHFEKISDYSADIKVLSTITSIDANTTRIELNKILEATVTGRFLFGVNEKALENLRSATAEQYVRAFEEDFIEPLKNKKGHHLYYDNKEIYDLYRKQRESDNKE